MNWIKIAVCLWIAAASVARGENTDLRADGLYVLPGVIELQGRQAAQRLIVQRYENGLGVEDVTERAVWESNDPDVVVVEQGRAKPTGNGKAKLYATVGDVTAEVVVRVDDFDQSVQWEFRRHVLPVLSRAGCNMGSCHGALAGKGGFRLSLRGYFPEGDYHTITREARGRRIELSDPGRSLLLAKPSTALPHKGGLKLPVDSLGYQIVSGWLTQGALAPKMDDPRLVKLMVEPADVTLKPADTQQLLVTAHYSDGKTEDVTAWAKYSSSDQTVADVDEHGRITVQGHGEGAVVVWFSSQLVLARVGVPFDNPISEDVFANLPESSFIDTLVNDKLQQLRLEPSPRCTDAEFLRRAFLDAIGRPPTETEAVAFLKQRDPQKRIQLVDQLLTHEDYVDYWTFKWSDLLLVNGRRLRPKSVKAYYTWIREHVEESSPWDDLVREVITATGSSYENGATNFYALHQDPENMTENVCQAFLGLSIGCAKCHNHPLEKWTNDEYYAMANFFSRVRAKGWGGDGRGGDGLRTLFVGEQGDLIQPLTGKPQWPTPLDGKPLPSDYDADRRTYLAEWLVSPDNTYFSRAIANRLWANFFGKGIVNPVDDLRVSNPARNEPLLEALSDYLVHIDFDLKRFMREIMVSETYQRSSVATEHNQADEHYFSRYFPRRLDAEVLLDAISQATGVPSQFNQIGYDGNDFENTSEYPLGTRAIELHDSAIVSDFLDTFGRNERDITCECERSNTPSIVQVLHISNGTTINDRLKDQASCVGHALETERPWDEIVEQAYLRTLSRYPEEQDLRAIVDELNAAPQTSRRDLLEDLYWSLMSSREFLFNH